MRARLTHLTRFLALTALLAPALLSAQKGTAAPALTFGTAVNGSTGPGGEAARYRVTVPASGVLTVVTYGEGDLTISVTDEDGQQVRDGRADTDYRGKMGAEYLAVPLPAGGTYGVEIGMNGGGAVAFRLVANFAAMAGFEMAADTDGRPRNARAATVGAALDDSLHPDEGDLADWYVITASEAMTLIVTTRVEEGSGGDLVLDAYLGEELNDAVAHSDQDLRDNAGNESMTVDLKAGETVRIKVASLSDTGGLVSYRLSLGRMP